jgi:hypothetical protein
LAFASVTFYSLAYNVKQQHEAIKSYQTIDQSHQFWAEVQRFGYHLCLHHQEMMMKMVAVVVETEISETLTSGPNLHG